MSHTPGPWHSCKSGDCVCKIISCADFPIAKVTAGEWGDEYPSIRVIGPSMDAKAEVYIERVAYGSVGEEMAKANCRLIAAAPDLLAALQGCVEFMSPYDNETKKTALAAVRKAMEGESERDAELREKHRELMGAKTEDAKLAN